jgi:hypothetical protein
LNNALRTVAKTVTGSTAIDEATRRLRYCLAPISAKAAKTDAVKWESVFTGAATSSRHTMCPAHGLPRRHGAVFSQVLWAIPTTVETSFTETCQRTLTTCRGRHAEPSGGPRVKMARGKGVTSSVLQADAARRSISHVAERSASGMPRDDGSQPECSRTRSPFSIGGARSRSTRSAADATVADFGAQLRPFLGRATRSVKVRGLEASEEP